MSLKDALARVFGFVGGLLKKAFEAAQANGLTDRIVADALELARGASQAFADNAERREWVVAQLRAAKVPDSIAQMAVEAAVQLLKKELAAQ